MLKPLLLLLVLSVSLPGFADTLKNTKDTRALADKVVQLFATEKFDQGIHLAMPYWPIPKVEAEGLIEKINQQWPMIKKRFGNETGTEFIRQESIGRSFVRYFYLQKFENHAIYWCVTFYRPDKTWKINSIVFRDTLDVLFSEDK